MSANLTSDILIDLFTLLGGERMNSTIPGMFLFLSALFILSGCSTSLTNKERSEWSLIETEKDPRELKALGFTADTYTKLCVEGNLTVNQALKWIDASQESATYSEDEAIKC